MWAPTKIDKTKSLPHSKPENHSFTNWKQRQSPQIIQKSQSENAGISSSGSEQGGYRAKVTRIPSDRASSIGSHESRNSNISTNSRYSQDTQKTTNSMAKIIKGVKLAKNDITETGMENCITDGPFGPAKTQKEVRNRKLFFGGLCGLVFVVILCLALKEVGYNNGLTKLIESKAKEEQMAKEREEKGRLEDPLGLLKNQFGGNQFNGMQYNPYLAGLFPSIYTFNQQTPTLQQSQNELARNGLEMPVIPQNAHFENFEPVLKTSLEDTSVNSLPRAAMQYAPPHNRPPPYSTFQNPRNVKIASESVRKVYKRLEKLLSGFVETISGYTTQIAENASYRAMVENDDQMAVLDLVDEELFLEETLKKEEAKIFHRLKSIDKQENSKQRKRQRVRLVEKRDGKRLRKEEAERKRERRLNGKEGKKRSFLGREIEESLRE